MMMVMMASEVTGTTTTAMDQIDDIDNNDAPPEQPTITQQLTATDVSSPDDVGEEMDEEPVEEEERDCEETIPAATAAVVVCDEEIEDEEDGGDAGEAEEVQEAEVTQAQADGLEAAEMDKVEEPSEEKGRHGSHGSHGSKHKHNHHHHHRRKHGSSSAAKRSKEEKEKAKAKKEKEKARRRERDRGTKLAPVIISEGTWIELLNSNNYNNRRVDTGSLSSLSERPGRRKKNRLEPKERRKRFSALIAASYQEEQIYWSRKSHRFDRYFRLYHRAQKRRAVFSIQRWYRGARVRRSYLFTLETIELAVGNVAYITAGTGTEFRLQLMTRAVQAATLIQQCVRVRQYVQRQQRSENSSQGPPHEETKGTRASWKGASSSSNSVLEREPSVSSPTSPTEVSTPVAAGEDSADPAGEETSRRSLFVPPSFGSLPPVKDDTSTTSGSTPSKTAAAAAAAATSPTQNAVDVLAADAADEEKSGSPNEGSHDHAMDYFRHYPDDFSVRCCMSQNTEMKKPKKRRSQLSSSARRRSKRLDAAAELEKMNSTEEAVAADTKEVKGRPELARKTSLQRVRSSRVRLLPFAKRNSSKRGDSSKTEGKEQSRKEQKRKAREEKKKLKEKSSSKKDKKDPESPQATRGPRLLRREPSERRVRLNASPVKAADTVAIDGEPKENRRFSFRRSASKRGNYASLSDELQIPNPTLEEDLELLNPSNELTLLDIDSEDVDAKALPSQTTTTTTTVPLVEQQSAQPVETAPSVAPAIVETDPETTPADEPAKPSAEPLKKNELGALAFMAASALKTSTPNNNTKARRRKK